MKRYPPGHATLYRDDAFFLHARRCSTAAFTERYPSMVATSDWLAGSHVLSDKKSAYPAPLLALS